MCDIILFHNKRTNFVLALLVLFSFSCNVINPAEPTPAYVNVAPFEFKINDVNQGSASNKIEDVWVYIDNEIQGVYQLPASFPVLNEGMHQVKLWPGVYLNGIKSQRFPYPFYAIYDTTVYLKPGSEISLTPRSTYNNGLEIINENFDSNGGIIFDSTANSKAIMTSTNLPDEIFEGAGSGKAVLDSAHYKLEIATSATVLPVLGSQRTFIEVNYKCSHELVVGFYAVFPSATDPVKYPVVVLKPQEEWNKLYLEITNLLHGNSEASGFKIYFYSSLNDLNSTGTVFLDNFKLIHD